MRKTMKDRRHFFALTKTFTIFRQFTTLGVRKAADLFGGFLGQIWTVSAQLLLQMTVGSKGITGFGRWHIIFCGIL